MSNAFRLGSGLPRGDFELSLFERFLWKSPVKQKHEHLLTRVKQTVNGKVNGRIIIFLNKNVYLKTKINACLNCFLE